MKSEEFLDKWLSKKYAGSKEIGNWTFEEVNQLLKDFQMDIWEKVQDYVVETEENENCYSAEIIGAVDLKFLLNISD